MYSTALLAAVVIGTAVADPTRPTLNMNGLYKLHPHNAMPNPHPDPSGGGNMLVVNTDQQLIATAQYDKQMNKTMMEGAACKVMPNVDQDGSKQTEFNVWPYFDEDLCFAQTTKGGGGDPFGPAPMGNTCWETITYENNFPIGFFGDNATFSGKDTCGDQWTVPFTSVHTQRYNNKETRVTVEEATFTFCFDDGGDLVEYQTEGSMTTGTQDANGNWIGKNQTEKMPPVHNSVIKVGENPGLSLETCISLDPDTSFAKYRALGRPSVPSPALHGMKVNDPARIAAINAQPGMTWTAGESAYMAGESLFTAARAMRTFMFPHEARPMVRAGVRAPAHVADDIPDTFDARTQWSQCSTIAKIRNQGGCGSCWAFGATETFEDRICVATNGQKNPLLSPEFLVDCDQTDQGCGGGMLDNAWRALQTIGLVEESCDPYQHCDNPDVPSCQAPRNHTSPPPPPPRPHIPTCPKQCADGSPLKTYKADQIYPVAKPGDVKSIQAELMKNGPVEVAYFVFSDFMNYKSGVYQRGAGTQMMGGHAVKLMGWGTESGTDYWLIANSWSPGWGDQGLFKIRRGTDECGIESMATAGIPKIDSLL